MNAELLSQPQRKSRRLGFIDVVYSPSPSGFYAAEVKSGGF